MERRRSFEFRKTKDERQLDDLLEDLKKAKERKEKCCLLIGAGCSQKAGIPLASEFIQIIKDTYPKAYDRASEKTYTACMYQLPVAERRRLIAKYIDQAKINWAHLCMAQLIKMGYIDRVLTTNFDPLVIRACALLNEFPAVYDFAASQEFKPGFIPDKSVFYLHGQYTGFLLLNTNEEFNKLSQSIEPIFKDSCDKRLWIVVGYSGENDPVFNHLTKIECFDENLYWIGFKKENPTLHVEKNLLQDTNKHAYYLRGYDADDFFITLAQKLACFPEFVDKPFSHLKQALQQIAPFPLARQKNEIDATKMPLEKVEKAIKDIENDEPPSSDLARYAESLLMSGQLKELIKMEDHLDVIESPELKRYIAWAYSEQGNEFTFQTLWHQGSDAAKLFKKAGKKFEKAISLYPKDPEAFSNWGHALYQQALTKQGKEADKLYSQAGEKYQKSATLNPEDSDVFDAWGTALADRAQTKQGKEADKLYYLASEKYQKAATLNPEDFNIFYNWGTTLAERAQTKEGNEADKLYSLAGEKLQKAATLNPEDFKIFYNWGNALAERAQTKEGNEADKLYSLAGEKLQKAATLNPQDSVVFYAWGTTLYERAKTKQGKEADKLYSLAGEKFQKAATLNPEDYNSFYNWGTALAERAKTKQGKEADKLYSLAGEKFQKAATIQPNNCDAWIGWSSSLVGLSYNASAKNKLTLLKSAEEKSIEAEKLKPGAGSCNLACIASLRNQVNECKKWLARAEKYNELTDINWLKTETDFDNVRDKPWFRNIIESLEK